MNIKEKDKTYQAAKFFFGKEFYCLTTKENAVVLAWLWHDKFMAPKAKLN